MQFINIFSLFETETKAFKKQNFSFCMLDELKAEIEKKAFEIKGRFVNSAKRKIIKEIINFSVNSSEKNIMRMLSLGERLISNEQFKKSYFLAIREAFEKKSHYLDLIKGSLSSLSKKSRERLIENFFINAGIFYAEKYKNVALNEKPPWFFVLSPTARCNLNCFGCYAGKYKKAEELSFEEIDRILKEAKQLGIYFVVISGGEPFMRKDLLDIFSKHNDIYFLVYTNGTLINKEFAEKLSEFGNVALAVSVEGMKKETEERRGKGSFEKIISAMQNLKNAGVLFGFSATATRKNYKIIYSEKFIDLFISQGCRFGWYFQYIPIGRNPETKLMVTPRQRNWCRKRVNFLRERKKIFLADFWNDGPYARGCIAGARPGGYFHINCNGNVEPCVFIQFYVDNIKGKSLKEVMNSNFFRIIREAQPYCRNKNLLTPCMIIDNPHVLRNIVKRCKVKASYQGNILFQKKIARFLDNYAKKFHSITDSIWEKEYKNFKCWKDF